MKYLSLATPFNLGAVGAVHYHYRVPVYPCPACGKAYPTYHLGYPHLDPASVLTPEELKFIDGKRPPGPADPQVTEGIIGKLEDHWGVPVGPGAFFGPLRIKVSRPLVKYDFVTVPMSFNTFLRREAALALQSFGFDFDFVEVANYGRYAAEADFVQLVIPVVAHSRLEAGLERCRRCRVVDGLPTEGSSWALYDSPHNAEHPFFLPVEWGPLIASSEFIQAARVAGVKGLIEGSVHQGATLRPVEVVPDPVVDRPIHPWPRVRDVGPIRPGPESSSRRKKRAPSGACPRWDRNAAGAWIEGLRAFLRRVGLQGGEAAFAANPPGSLGERVPDHWPKELRDLMEACGGRLSLRYSLEREGRTLSGGCRLELGVMEKDCRSVAEETWVAEDLEQREAWLNALPFFALANGDFLALDGRVTAPTLPVVYLSHEGPSEIVGSSLGSFLFAWERLGYLGPELWVLNEFLDTDTGLLSAESAAARSLRELLP